MKIKEIHARDFLAIRDIALTMDGATTVLAGNNGAGKSSIFRALMAALLGKAAVPEMPVRDGAEQAEITVTTDEGYIITARIRPDRDYRIEVKAGELAVRAPAAWLKERFAGLDALAFLGLDARGQADAIRRVAGVDTAALDAERRRIYDARREWGVALREREGVLAALPCPAGAMGIEEAEGVLAGVYAEAERATAAMRARTSWETRIQLAREELAACAEDVPPPEGPRPDRAAAEAALRAVIEAERAWDEQQRASQQTRAARERASAQIDELARTEPPAADMPDIDAARQAVEDARAAAHHRRLAALVEDHRAKYAEGTARIEAIDAQRARMLAEASFPVPGLGFDEAGGLTLDGHPFAQASQAERMRASLGVAMAPRPPLLFVQDAALLDADSMRIVREMAEASGVHVLIERVAEEPGSVVIEGGTVRP